MEEWSARRASSGARFVPAFAVALAVFAAASEVRAQAAPAPSHEKNAQVAYALQDWPTAIREFEAAFQAEQKPDFLWGIAQAQRLSGDCKAAINTYKSYRRSEINAEQSAAADSRIQHCEQDLQQQQAAQAPAPPVTPAPGVAPPPPPSAANPSATQSTLPAEHADAHRPFYGDALGDTLMLTGLAAAGVGTYFLLAGNSAMNKAKDAAYADYDSETRHASREQLIGVTALAGGGVFVACGVARYLTFGDSSSGRSAALSVSPLGLDLRGRF
ncbi:MAG: hypothetical protein ABUL62_32565 [Myxococcales bacterium]